MKIDPEIRKALSRLSKKHGLNTRELSINGKTYKLKTITESCWVDSEIFTATQHFINGREVII